MRAAVSQSHRHTRASLFRTGHTLLSEAGIENAEQEVAWILEWVLGCTQLALRLEGQCEVGPEPWEAALRLLQRRAEREPLQYILGSQEFCGLEFVVNDAVLIPRPETELLVEQVLARNRSVARPVIADVGTGSGCIAVTVARALPDAIVWATDASSHALDVARENAQRHQVQDRVRFLHGDLCDPLREAGLQAGVTSMVANAPYVPDDELAVLQPDVRQYEPRMALAGGPDGMAILRRLIAASPEYVQPGGWIVLEVGPRQADRLKRIGLESGSYSQADVGLDAAGIERVLSFQRHGGAG